MNDLTLSLGIDQASSDAVKERIQSLEKAVESAKNALLDLNSTPLKLDVVLNPATTGEKPPALTDEEIALGAIRDLANICRKHDRCEGCVLAVTDDVSSACMFREDRIPQDIPNAFLRLIEAGKRRETGDSK